MDEFYPINTALLAHCPDAECEECSKIICPHGDPMHFHHDGCLSCMTDSATLTMELYDAPTP